jgi:hypothetical protein
MHSIHSYVLSPPTITCTTTSILLPIPSTPTSQTTFKLASFCSIITPHLVKATLLRSISTIACQGISTLLCSNYSYRTDVPQSSFNIEDIKMLYRVSKSQLSLHLLYNRRVCSRVTAICLYSSPNASTRWNSKPRPACYR